MQWKGRRESGNVVDKRGAKVAGTLGGGGLIFALIYFLISGDPSVLINSTTQNQPVASSPAQDTEQTQFVKVVLADTEDTWNKIFSEQGRSYPEPRLVLFSGRVNSACGTANSAVGPFYCPRDQQVYMDLSFARELSDRFGAKGDFALAYVIAHEVGHHVQNALGRFQNEERSNAASVQTELQADCYAGIWAADTERSKQVLDPGDVEEAMGAAAAVGDDRLQQQSQGYVVPDSFTHGSSAQRMAAFKRGFEGGSLNACSGSFGGSEAVTGRG